MKHLLLCAVFIATPLMAESVSVTSGTLTVSTWSFVTPGYGQMHTLEMPYDRMPGLSYNTGDELMKRLDRIEKRLDELEKKQRSPIDSWPESIGRVTWTEPYTCERCKKTFKTKVPRVCAVHHGPGQCCHYGEEEVKP